MVAQPTTAKNSSKRIPTIMIIGTNNGTAKGVAADFRLPKLFFNLLNSSTSAKLIPTKSHSVKLEIITS